MRAETQHAIDNILDTFTGADGGGRYLHFMAVIRGLDRQAQECVGTDEGENAERILNIVKQFSRLLDSAQRIA
jgi:hypothetical protein